MGSPSDKENPASAFNQICRPVTSFGLKVPPSNPLPNALENAPAMSTYLYGVRPRMGAYQLAESVCLQNRKYASLCAVLPWSANIPTPALTGVIPSEVVE